MATLKLFDKENLADNVWVFRFHPSEPLEWTAGQFVRVELPHEHYDEERTKRVVHDFVGAVREHRTCAQLPVFQTRSTYAKVYDVNYDQFRLLL
jgi:hypothetical protein